MTVIDQSEAGLVLEHLQPSDACEPGALGTVDPPEPGVAAEFLLPARVPELGEPRAVPEPLVSDAVHQPIATIRVSGSGYSAGSASNRNWLDSKVFVSSALPAALRSVPCHGVQLKRRFVRRQTPKVSFALLGVLFVVVFFAFTRMASYRQTPLNYFLSVVWSMYVPLMLIGFIGALYLRLQQRRGRMGRSAHGPAKPGTGRHARIKRAKPLRSGFSGRTDRLLIVTVPTLLAQGNLPALQRVLLSLLINLPQHFDRFHVDVITEGSVDDLPLMLWLEEIGEMGRPMRIVNVPPDYETPRGARFKTRANQFAMEARRAAGENTPHCYVYHLDDDTHIGKDTAASLAEFIELDGDHYFLAQGVLTFPHNLTPSRFCRLADSIRPADDLTRFAFFTGALGTPLGGLHGEHLIVRADIEDEIGWDFPNTVIEDAYFAIQFAMRYPRRSTMLNSYSYGASPATITDLVRQRRRWIEGLLRLAFNRELPLLPKIPLLCSIFTWSMAPFQFVGLALLISFATGIDNTSPISPWFLPLWTVGLTGIFWMYIEGLKVNLSASDRPPRHILLAVVIVPAIYVITLVETLGVMLGIVRFMGFGRQRVSEVISKPV
jgi:egghead protein (zeste-white 4 protein)